ncbi:MAG: hypothetical protein GY820_48570 [Gammaproteobacteria bacterium]|nr:hypothetical protein [Gammaproteobacteria bacterium]
MEPKLYQQSKIKQQIICFQYKFINQMLWPITMLQASIHEEPGCWG